MYVVVYITFHLMILSLVDKSMGLEETSQRDCDNIIKTELAIRTTMNKLFLILKLKKERGEKFKQYTLLHNYFISLALQDHFAFKTIIEISEVNNSIDNATKNFIGLINEILDKDGDAKSEDLNEYSTLVVSVTQNLVEYLNRFLKTLINLHDTNEAFGSRGFNVNQEVVRILGQNYSNKSAVGKNEVFEESEFWVPDKSAEMLNSRRIFEGKNIKVKYFPFMASLHVLGQFQCSASIIKDDLVITASSCLQLIWNNRLYRENPNMVAIRIGSHFYNGGGDLIPILEIYFHPDYEPRTLRNNLALLRTHRVIKFQHRKRGKRHKKIAIIELPKLHGAPVTEEITIIGYGVYTKGGTIVNPWKNRLSYAVLNLFPFDDCRERYGKEFVSTTNFCAGFLSKGGGACNHDVGGPGVVDGHLAGVVSFGSPVCGSPGLPTVFTQLSYYGEWIDKIKAQHIVRDKRYSTIDPHHTATVTFKPYKTAFTTPRHHHHHHLRQSSFETTTSAKEIFRDFLRVMFDNDEVEQMLTHVKADKMKETNVKEKLEERYKVFLGKGTKNKTSEATFREAARSGHHHHHSHETSKSKELPPLTVDASWGLFNKKPKYH